MAQFFVQQLVTPEDQRFGRLVTSTLDPARYSTDKPDTIAEPCSRDSADRRPATVNGSPPEWTRINDGGAAQRTPDLSAIVQEIVNSGNWQSGNALVLLIDGSGRRNTESFNAESDSDPLLRVEYK